MSSLKKILLSISLLGLILIPTHFVHAQYGLGETAGAAGLGEGSRYPSDVPTLIGNVIGTALSMIAVIFFLLMVYGGFLWMTAHGDSAQVDKAKDTIIAAVIGIIVVLASYAITNFVFNATKATGNPSKGAPAATVYCLNGNDLTEGCTESSSCSEGKISFPTKATCEARICELSLGASPLCNQ